MTTTPAPNNALQRTGRELAPAFDALTGPSLSLGALIWRLPRVSSNRSMRYLTEYHINTALHRGKAVEQFLGGGTHGELRTIRYLNLRPDGERFCLTYHEHLDEGSESWLDIYAFTPEPPDEDPPNHFFEIVEEALRYSESAFGALPLRWVNEGVTQDEYADYLRSNVA